MQLPGPNGPLSKMEWMNWNKIFAKAHHTCMLHHILKVPDALEKCKGIVCPAYHQQYLKLFNSSKEKLGSKKTAADDNAIFVSELQSNAVSTLQSSKKSSCQMTIQTDMECTCQSDIHHTNNAILEMAFADFFSKNKPVRVVESTQFKQLLEKAKYVGINFKISCRKKFEVRPTSSFFNVYNFR